jgi:hypothetical protein
MNSATESSSSPAAMQLGTDYPSPNESPADASNKMPLPMDESSADASTKMPLPINTGKAILRAQLEELGYKEPIPPNRNIREITGRCVSGRENNYDARFCKCIWEGKIEGTLL